MNKSGGVRGGENAQQKRVEQHAQFGDRGVQTATKPQGSLSATEHPLLYCGRCISHFFSRIADIGYSEKWRNFRQIERTLTDPFSTPEEKQLAYTALEDLIDNGIPCDLLDKGISPMMPNIAKNDPVKALALVAKLVDDPDLTVFFANRIGSIMPDLAEKYPEETLEVVIKLADKGAPQYFNGQDKLRLMNIAIRDASDEQFERLVNNKGMKCALKGNIRALVKTAVSDASDQKFIQLLFNMNSSELLWVLGTAGGVSDLVEDDLDDPAKQFRARALLLMASNKNYAPSEDELRFAKEAGPETTEYYLIALINNASNGSNKNPEALSKLMSLTARVAPNVYIKALKAITDLRNTAVESALEELKGDRLSQEQKVELANYLIEQRLSFDHVVTLAKTGLLSKEDSISGLNALCESCYDKGGNLNANKNKITAIIDAYLTLSGSFTKEERIAFLENSLLPLIQRGKFKDIVLSHLNIDQRQQLAEDLTGLAGKLSTRSDINSTDIVAMKELLHAATHCNGQRILSHIQDLQFHLALAKNSNQSKEVQLAAAKDAAEQLKSIERESRGGGGLIRYISSQKVPIQEEAKTFLDANEDLCIKLKDLLDAGSPPKASRVDFGPLDALLAMSDEDE